MYSLYVVFALVLLFVGLSLREFFRHQNRVYKVPIRIHVNGTRGKSSVTRLIGAGLRAGKIRTITKVTGTYPRLAMEDGTEVHVHRRGDPNIIEQLSIVKLAAERQAQAIVVECMALEPQYQWITEHQMIHSSVGVITNVRLDHIDVMGTTVGQIARALARTIPRKQHFFTAENVVGHILRETADRLQTITHETNSASVSDEEMRGFQYLEHRENVALALAVCEHLGIDRRMALQGMYEARPDAGVLQRFVVLAETKRIVFYNAFAANDPNSTLMIWRKLKREDGLPGKRIILLNTRHDRVDRAHQLTEMIGQSLAAEVDYVVLIGRCSGLVRRMLQSRGVKQQKIVSIGWSTPEVVFEKVLSLTDLASTVFGIGNMGGMGGPVADYFKMKSREHHD
jgi:poly-gamma-glutamate synthase PgsB/CapB